MIKRKDDIMQNNLYTAELAGQSWDKDKRYELVIITKWKDRTDKSPEEGHKAYYFTTDNRYLSECIKDEDWCRRIYEAYSENTRFRIERKVEYYVEN